MKQFVDANRTRRVLVVDDEMVNRELLTEILSLDYEVSTAESGTVALGMLKEASEPYSLILLDILMPGMNGFEVIKACKKDEKLKNIPIIVMTSEKSAEGRSIKLGAADFIAKPYRMPEVILARLERIVELSEEKELIRSIEKDAVTGLYIKPFFVAYLRRAIPGVKRPMDAVALFVDGLEAVFEKEKDAGDRILKEIASHIKERMLLSKGIACYKKKGRFYIFTNHREDYEKLVASIGEAVAALPLGEGVTLTAGVCEVDRNQPGELWFTRAKEACLTATKETPVVFDRN